MNCPECLNPMAAYGCGDCHGREVVGSRGTWWERNGDFVGLVLWSIVTFIVCSLAWKCVDAAEAIFR